MSDENAKPRMPRRPEQRKPEPKRKLKKTDLKRMDRVEEEELLLTVDERACAHLATEYSREHAATVLGWSLEAVNEVLIFPHVRRYLEKADQALLQELAKAKVRVMRKVGISRATIEQRLMELAQLTPEETRGRIDGQVKAAYTLAKIYGMLNDEKDPLLGKTPEELQGIIMNTARMLPATLQTETKVQ